MLNTSGEASVAWAIPVLFMAPGVGGGLVEFQEDLTDGSRPIGNEPGLSEPNDSGTDLRDKRRFLPMWFGVAALALFLGWWMVDWAPMVDLGVTRGIGPVEGGNGEETESVEPVADSGLSAAKSASPESLGAAKSASPLPPVAKPAKRQVSLKPTFAGKVALFAFNSATGSADRSLVSVIEGALWKEFKGTFLSVPSADEVFVEEIQQGELLASSGNGFTPWGAEFLLVASGARKQLPQSAPHLVGVALTLRVKIHSLADGQIVFRSQDSHTGVDISEEGALLQATERCLRGAAGFLKGG